MAKAEIWVYSLCLATGKTKNLIVLELPTLRLGKGEKKLCLLRLPKLYSCSDSQDSKLPQDPKLPHYCQNKRGITFSALHYSWSVLTSAAHIHYFWSIKSLNPSQSFPLTFFQGGYHYAISPALLILRQSFLKKTELPQLISNLVSSCRSLLST